MGETNVQMSLSDMEQNGSPYVCSHTQIQGSPTATSDTEFI